MKFRFNLSDQVYDKFAEETAVVIQKRVMYGNAPYYRLDNDRIVHERFLYGMKERQMIKQ